MHDHQRKANSCAVPLAIAAVLLLVVMGLMFVGGYLFVLMRVNEARRLEAAARNLALAEEARERNRFIPVPELNDEPPFIIHVGADGRISIDDQPLNLEEFVERFRQNDKPMPPIEIRSHPDCTFGRIDEVTRALREVGVERYHIVPAEAEAAESDDADDSPAPSQ